MTRAGEERYIILPPSAVNVDDYRSPGEAGLFDLFPRALRVVYRSGSQLLAVSDSAFFLVSLSGSKPLYLQRDELWLLLSAGVDMGWRIAREIVSALRMARDRIRLASALMWQGLAEWLYYREDGLPVESVQGLVKLLSEAPGPRLAVVPCEPLPYEDPYVNSLLYTLKATLSLLGYRVGTGRGERGPCIVIEEGVGVCYEQ